MTINHLVFICCVWYFSAFAGFCGRIGNSSEIGHFSFMHNNDIEISLNFRIQFSTILDIESFSKWFLIENYTAVTSTLNLIIYVSNMQTQHSDPTISYPVVRFYYPMSSSYPDFFSWLSLHVWVMFWESSLQLKPTHIDAPSDTGPYIHSYW